MANHYWYGNAAFAAHWQSPLLRVMLRCTGLSGILAPWIAVGFSRTFRPELLLALATGALLLALSFAKFERGRLVATAYVSIALVTTLIFGAWFGWVPDVVVVLSYLVLAGGLLFGPRFVYGLGVSVALLLFLGGALLRARVYDIAVELDPAVYQTWLRTALGFCLLTGAAAWVVLEAARGVLRTQTEAAHSLALARDRLRETEASRARRLQQEQALLDAQKLQSVAQLGDGFARVVTNSLTLVRRACQDARALDTEEARRVSARAICAAVDDCTLRTRDLLLLSRPHASLPARVELHGEVLAHTERLKQRVRSNIRCEFELEPAGSVLVPPSWLPQLLANLLLNAEVAIQGSGTIRVSTRSVEIGATRASTIDALEPGVYATLEVSDDGEGMTPEVVAHACEPFFTTRGRAGHDGLGLTLVHSMLRQLGGTLALQSDGQGSTITAYFPVASAPPEASSTPPSSPGKGTRVTSEQRALAASEASTAPSDPDWRSGALRRTARTAAFVAVAGAVVIGAFLENWLFPSLFVLATGPLMILVSHPRLPYYLRLTFVLSTLLGVGALFLMRYSFLSPGAVAMLAQTVFLASLFGGPRIALAMLIVTTLCFVAGGALWPHIDTRDTLSEMLFDDASNWFRVGVVLPLVLLVNGHTVLDVFRLAAERVQNLDRARRELDHRQEQHQAETDALVRAESMRGRAERIATAGRLTGVVAHDLNNSLMTLLGWAELLEHSVVPQEALQNLEQAAEDAEALLQTLRDRTDVEHRGAGLDLALALERARPMLDAVWQTHAEQRCTLDLDADSGCFVGIQEGSFRRLLVNLVTNARHAVGERAGSCRVRLRHAARGVDLSVVDTGEGMDTETHARIFEPFFTTKPDQGSGLGLFSVSEIVSATGGTLEVSSVPDAGTTFAIHWPVAEFGTSSHRV